MFRVIFVPLEEAKNHVLLLSALLDAIHSVVAYCMKLFRNYYTKRSPHEDTQAFLKVCDKRLERGISIGEDTLQPLWIYV